MQITKTTVQAKTRKLNVKWSLLPAEYQIKPFEPDVRDAMIAEAKRRFKLQEHGTRVEFYEHDISDIMEWCMENLKHDYEQSTFSVLMTPEDLAHVIHYAETGERDSDYLEYKWSMALQRSIDAEEDFRMAKGYFWFEDANEAMRFKLTWGGQ